MVSAVPREQRRRRYWRRAGLALFVLLTVDLLTTALAVRAYGVGGEANPIMAYLLGSGFAVLLGVHLAVLAVLAALFYALIELAVRAPSPFDEVVAASFEVWSALLVVAGVVVAANNLAVVFFGWTFLPG
ncbi:DUF5658 family protein [Halocalculus aciditolerans]|uniref:DUF5658 domain-containing protein n=1 Tax=Halocalculus aciditolerans TaxID=1383812 RepID=A0A830FGK2_9EURY|nr:DUF5658 family protein [Halocalculus aciditolerans]GGL53280.1 hypothetical protein GCM10009039_09350 [Halocalculus aciditolerans]